jgi:hypothetical protein
MIKRYLEFIKEESFNTIGEWVESLYNDNYIKNIVNRYIEDIHPDIRVSSCVNILDEKVQKDIKFQIDNYLKSGIIEKEPVVSTSTETEELLESTESMTTAGKGIFTSFLKSLTALGKKETKPDFDKCPNDFLLYYHYTGLNSEDVKTVFSRFKSLSAYVNLIDYAKNEVDLYFGVKCDGSFEYGISYDKHLQIGQFKLTSSVIKWIVLLESKSATSLKKEMVNLGYNDILLLGKIKSDMIQLFPGYHEKRSNATINDRVIRFGYFGLGKWDNGKIDENEFLNIKSKFSTWVSKRKWGSKVLISVEPKSFWVYVNLKLK